jgi:uracil-DNA glycosylase family 4
MPDAMDELMERVVACRACPRLVEHRERSGQVKVKRYMDWDYWAKPVPGFGSADAELCIVGLAPAAHGGNRTGRMFTGDPSADFLATALYEGGFASQSTSQHRGDGMTMVNAYITAAVRCAPPDNQPTVEEQARCRLYLIEELGLMPNMKAVLALGKLGFDSYLRAAKEQGLVRPKGVVFGHRVQYDLGPGFPTLFGSYHPSPHNTYTRRLTHEGLVDVMRDVQEFLAAS